MAKKFQFRLNALLRLREQVEKQRQRELAELLTQIRQYEQQVRRLHAEIRDEDEFLRSVIEPGRTVDMRLVSIHRRFVQATGQQILEVLRQLAGIRKRAEAARQRLVEATQERRALEILRDRQRAAYLAALGKAEDRMLDEIALNGRGRPLGHGGV
jgi:flagellar FliJ protein